MKLSKSAKTVFLGLSLFCVLGTAQAAVLTGAKWGPSQSLGTAGGEVTYSFMPTGTGTSGEHPGTFSHVSAAGLGTGVFEAAVGAAFSAWSSVSNITFTEVADFGNPFSTGPGGQGTDGSGDIRIGMATFDGAGGTLAHGYFPQVGAPSFAGDIHFDIDDLWKNGFGGPGFDVFQVMAHEIGHAIGLGHTNVPSSLMNPFYSEAFLGLQADDIAGAQQLYGSVPAPSTVLLLLVGMIGLLVRSKRI